MRERNRQLGFSEFEKEASLEHNTALILKRGRNEHRGPLVGEKASDERSFYRTTEIIAN
jgi:hypothetical protein